MAVVVAVLARLLLPAIFFVTLFLAGPASVFRRPSVPPPSSSGSSLERGAASPVPVAAGSSGAAGCGIPENGTNHREAIPILNGTGTPTADGIGFQVSTWNGTRVPYAAIVLAGSGGTGLAGFAGDGWARCTAATGRAATSPGGGSLPARPGPGETLVIEPFGAGVRLTGDLLGITGTGGRFGRNGEAALVQDRPEERPSGPVL